MSKFKKAAGQLASTVGLSTLCASQAQAKGTGNTIIDIVENFIDVADVIAAFIDRAMIPIGLVMIAGGILELRKKIKLGHENKSSAVIAIGLGVAMVGYKILIAAVTNTVTE